LHRASFHGGDPVTGYTSTHHNLVTPVSLFVVVISVSAFVLAVRMSVAIIPVAFLLSVVLLIVLTIVLVPFLQIASIGVVFVIVPVMIITMVPIVDSDLDPGLLRSGAGHECRWCNNGSSQK
jgi:hypothetical protein